MFYDEDAPQCNFCNELLTKGIITTCGKCQVVIYCSEKCREQDWLRGCKDQLYAHSFWCPTLAYWVKREAQTVLNFPFPFAVETTSPDFAVGGTGICSFLLSRGVLGKGLWQFECSLWEAPLSELSHTKDHSEGSGWINEDFSLPGDSLLKWNYFDWDRSQPFHLPAESVLLSLAPPTSMQETKQNNEDTTDETTIAIPEPLEPPPLPDIPVLSNWEEYYQWRGLSLNSPVCCLLQWPLTLYYIATQLLPHFYPNLWRSLGRKRHMNILLLGVEKEVDLIATFQELHFLLPGWRIDLTLIGANISPRVNEWQREEGLLRFRVLRGCYHQLALESELATPDLAVAFNSGLAAYSSWIETIMKLKSQSVPFFHTDYCIHSILLSQRVLQQWDLAPTAAPAQSVTGTSSTSSALSLYSPHLEVNPFRGVFRLSSSSMRVARFSNAWLSMPLKVERETSVGGMAPSAFLGVNSCWT